MNQPDIESKLLACRGGTAGVTCRDDRPYSDYDRPLEIAPQDHDLSDDDPGKQHDSIVRPGEHQTSKREPKTGIPGSQWQSLELVDEANPLQRDISDDDCRGRGPLAGHVD